MTPPDFVPDLGRGARAGVAEAVYCAGKTPAQIEAILDAAHGHGAPLLLTRLDAATLGALPARWRGALDHEPLSRTAYLGEPTPPTGPARVAVVSAGTSDLPVAREAVRTLRFHGEAALEVADVGVAGLWRLLDRIEEIRALPVTLAVAGMDAALASVLGGLVGGVLIGVPTSVGYGVAAGGATALHAMLASCAQGLAVVNVDNGFGAACAALRALRALAPAAAAVPSSGAPARAG